MSPPGAIQSMTGYGRGAARSAAGTVTVELRSTNHRYLELEFRMANGLAALQRPLTELLRGQFQRGRIEVTLTVQGAQGRRRRVVFDEPLVRGYRDALTSLRDRLELQGSVTLDQLLALPQAVTVIEEALPPEALWASVRGAALRAVQALAIARRREGGRLAADLRQQVRRIERHAHAVRARLPRAMAQQRRELVTRLRGLLGAKASVAPSQLAEAASLIKDVDIHEELVRLSSHLHHLRQTLAGGALVGKQLDFIAQELMREVNTMGSKANDAVAARAVVEMKGCIEKLREQGQNLQ